MNYQSQPQQAGNPQPVASPTQTPAQAQARQVPPYAPQGYAPQGYVPPYYAAYYPPAKPKKKHSKGFVVFLCVLGAVLVFGFGVMASQLVRYALNDTPNVSEQTPQKDTDSLEEDALKPGVDSGDNDLVIRVQKQAGESLSTTDIARMSQNSVLGISVYSTNGVLNSEASGVVAGENAAHTKSYIITCAHVICEDKGGVFKIVDSSGKEYLAAVLGYDESCDIGVLSVEKTGFEAAVFGDSEQLLSGDTVIAVGNSGGSEFFGSVTKGIISSTNRMLPISGQTINCIQHDAAINPGASGGALYNIYGQVVGINYSKIAMEYYEGMNFAVPANKVVERANKIIAEGIRTKGAKLGIEYYVAASYFDENYKQLVINSIDEKSDLKGKAQKGDFIIAVDGEKITDKYTITQIINEKAAGDEITLTIAQKNTKTDSYDTKDVSVTLMEKE